MHGLTYSPGNENVPVLRATRRTSGGIAGWKPENLDLSESNRSIFWPTIPIPESSRRSLKDDAPIVRRRRRHRRFQNWLSIITGAGRALVMGAYTGADESVETRTSSYYAKTHHGVSKPA